MSEDWKHTEIRNVSSAHMHVPVCHRRRYDRSVTEYNKKHSSRMPTARQRGWGGWRRRSSSDQVWTGLHSWLPDATSGGDKAGSLYGKVPCLGGGDCRDRSLHDEFQCIMGNDPPCGQTNTTENITFPQLCWQVIMSSPGVAFSKAPT